MSARHHTLHVQTAGPPLSLSMMVVESGRPGPHAVVTANVHGDEVVGVLAAHQLVAELPAALTCGTVTVLPSLNPRGLAACVRELGSTGKDLNRSFPGDSSGPEAATARALWDVLRANLPDLLLDLHSDSAASIPYVIVDRAVRLASSRRTVLEAKLAELASNTGLTVLAEYPDEMFLRCQLDKSLSGAVVNLLGRPALTIELGPRRVADADAVTHLVAIVKAQLAHLGMHAPMAAPTVGVPGRWRRGAGPRARHAGLVRPFVALGQEFRAGDVLAHVVGIDGTVRSALKATVAGIVVSWPEKVWVEVGTVVGTLGVREA